MTYLREKYFEEMTNLGNNNIEELTFSVLYFLIGVIGMSFSLALFERNGMTLNSVKNIKNKLE